MYFTQQNDATSWWCVGVEVHSHISSVMQTQQSQSIPTTCPLLLLSHSCSISHFVSSHSSVNVSSVHVWKVFFLKSCQCGSVALKVWSVHGLATCQLEINLEEVAFHI